MKRTFEQAQLGQGSAMTKAEKRREAKRTPQGQDNFQVFIPYAHNPSAREEETKTRLRAALPAFISDPAVLMDVRVSDRSGHVTMWFNEPQAARRAMRYLATNVEANKVWPLAPKWGGCMSATAWQRVCDMCNWPSTTTRPMWVVIDLKHKQEDGANVTLSDLRYDWLRQHYENAKAELAAQQTDQPSTSNSAPQQAATLPPASWTKTYEVAREAEQDLETANPKTFWQREEDDLEPAAAEAAAISCAERLLRLQELSQATQPKPDAAIPQVFHSTFADEESLADLLEPIQTEFDAEVAPAAVATGLAAAINAVTSEITRPAERCATTAEASAVINKAWINRRDQMELLIKKTFLPLCACQWMLEPRTQPPRTFAVLPRPLNRYEHWRAQAEEAHWRLHELTKTVAKVLIFHKAHAHDQQASALFHAALRYLAKAPNSGLEEIVHRWRCAVVLARIFIHLFSDNDWGFRNIPIDDAHASLWDPPEPPRIDPDWPINISTECLGDYTVFTYRFLLMWREEGEPEMIDHRRWYITRITYAENLDRIAAYGRRDWKLDFLTSWYEATTS